MFPSDSDRRIIGKLWWFIFFRGQHGHRNSRLIWIQLVVRKFHDAAGRYLLVLLHENPKRVLAVPLARDDLEPLLWVNPIDERHVHRHTVGLSGAT